MYKYIIINYIIINKMETYETLHKTSIKKSNPIDLETLEPVSLDDTHNKLKSISIGNFPFETKYFTLDFAKNWFIDLKKKINPYTNILAPKSFMSRLQLHLEARGYFSENLDYKPTIEYLSAIFSRYLQDTNSISPQELCEIKLFLHMDDTGFLSDWVVGDKTELRDKGAQLIAQAEPGSWLIRTCSIKDSDVFKARAVTYKNLSGNVDFFAIGYLYSHGYMILSCKPEYQLPGLDNKSLLPLSSKIYASFIDCLEELSHIRQFTLSKIIHNENAEANAPGAADA